MWNFAICEKLPVIIYIYCSTIFLGIIYFKKFRRGSLDCVVDWLIANWFDLIFLNYLTHTMTCFPIIKDFFTYPDLWFLLQK
jgi:hypothetical protein